MKIQFTFAWFDFWVGLFYDQKKNWLYIFPIPMVGFIFKLPQRRWFYSYKMFGFNYIGTLEIKPKKYKGTIKMYWAKNGSDIPIFKKDLTLYNSLANQPKIYILNGNGKS